MRNEEIVYDKGISSNETLKMITGVGIPLGVFAFALLTISTFAEFGSKLLLPMTAAMWICGLGVAIYLPSMREEVIGDTMKAIVAYCAAMIGFKILLKLTSGVSSEMIGASFNQAIPTTTGNAIYGYLQNIMWITSVMTPIGFLGMQVSRIVKFRKTRSIQKAFGQARGIRDSGNAHNRLY